MTVVHPYAEWTEHPLKDVPADIFTAARGVLAKAVQWHDVDADVAEAIADAVVIALVPWLTWEGR